MLDVRDTNLNALFVEFCKEFGIPSHLKKHGSSNYKVFRLLPKMPDLKLTEISEGKLAPSIGWTPFWKYLLKYCLSENEEAECDVLCLPKDKPELNRAIYSEARMRFDHDKYSSVTLSPTTTYISMKKR